MPVGADYEALNDNGELEAGLENANKRHDYGSRFTGQSTNRAVKVVTWFGRFAEINAGFLLVGAAQLFFALMDLAVKLLNEIDPPVPTLELIFVRMGITYIFCIAYLHWRKIPDPFLGPKSVRLLLATRGFCGFIGLFGTYYSLQYLSLSDATALFFVAPLFTAVCAAIFLREQFRLQEALAGVLSLIGVVLIARPEAIFGPEPGTGTSSGDSTSSQRLVAVGVALLGVVGAGGAYTSIRAIGDRAHALHSMSYFSIWCVIASTAGMASSRERVVVPNRLEWLAMLLMIGVFGFCAQMLLTLGLQREAAGRSAMAIYIQIVFAIVLERIFFHTVPRTLSVIGIVIILGSAIYVAILKQPKNADVDQLEADEGGSTDPERHRLLDDSEER